MNYNIWLFVRIGLLGYSIAYPVHGPVSAHATPPIDISSLIMGFVFGIIAIQFLLAIQFVNKRSAEIWDPPSWAENPFQLKQPVVCLHFIVWLYIGSSIVSIIKTWLKNPEFVFDALMPLVIGVGLLIGVHLSRLLFQSKFRNI